MSEYDNGYDVGYDVGVEIVHENILDELKNVTNMEELAKIIEEYSL